jgi:hypothetical protein
VTILGTEMKRGELTACKAQRIALSHNTEGRRTSKVRVKEQVKTKNQSKRGTLTLCQAQTEAQVRTFKETGKRSVLTLYRQIRTSKESELIRGTHELSRAEGQIRRRK